MRQIDFTNQEKEAERENKQNANTVALRTKKPQKRITRQVRLSASNIKRLKVRAAEDERTMANLLDEIIDEYFSRNE